MKQITLTLFILIPVLLTGQSNFSSSLVPWNALFISASSQNLQQQLHALPVIETTREYMNSLDVEFDAEWNKLYIYDYTYKDGMIRKHNVLFTQDMRVLWITADDANFMQIIRSNLNGYTDVYSIQDRVYVNFEAVMRRGGDMVSVQFAQGTEQFASKEYELTIVLKELCEIIDYELLKS